jgi:hypothetical protein
MTVWVTPPPTWYQPKQEQGVDIMLSFGKRLSLVTSMKVEPRSACCEIDLKNPQGKFLRKLN